jgi:chromosome segregation ATPase
VVAIIWYRTRQELRAIRREIAQLSRVDPSANRQLDHVSQLLDAMAVDLERLAENQRYTTRLLTQGEPLALAPRPPA